MKKSYQFYGIYILLIGLILIFSLSCVDTVADSSALKITINQPDKTIRPSDDSAALDVSRIVIKGRLNRGDELTLYEGATTLSRSGGAQTVELLGLPVGTWELTVEGFNNFTEKAVGRDSQIVKITGKNDSPLNFTLISTADMGFLEVSLSWPISEEVESIKYKILDQSRMNGAYPKGYGVILVQDKPKEEGWPPDPKNPSRHLVPLLWSHGERLEILKGNYYLQATLYDKYDRPIGVPSPYIEAINILPDRLSSKEIKFGSDLHLADPSIAEDDGDTFSPSLVDEIEIDVKRNGSDERIFSIIFLDKKKEALKGEPRGVTYEWFLEGTELVGQTNASLILNEQSLDIPSISTYSLRAHVSAPNFLKSETIIFSFKDDHDFVDITYYPNEGEGSRVIQTITKDEVITIAPASTFTRPGYTFSTWNSEADGSGEQYTPGNSYSATEDTNFHAQWTPTTYTVTFNANGGTPNPPSKEVSYNQSHGTLPTVTRHGYTFGGWEDSNGTIITDSTVVTRATDYMLSARWVPKGQYQITYNSNGGSGSIPMQSEYEGTPITLSNGAGLTKTGYTLQGWSTTKDGAKEYNLGAQYTAGTSITLYAVWEAKTYTVSFNTDGGSTAPEEIQVTFDTTYGSKGNFPTNPDKANHTFDGWYLGGTKITQDSVLKTAENHQLKASWTEIGKYMITYNSNRGDGSNDETRESALAHINTPITLLGADAFSNTGHSFAGWNTKADGSGTPPYAAGATYTGDKNITLYAKWTANKYTVNLDREGGTTGSTSVEAIYDSAMPSAEAPTREGYTFDGYYDDKNGAGNQYYNSSMASENNWDKDSGATLYAKWTANTYTVTLDPNGGSDGTTTFDVTYGSALPNGKVAPTRTGYTFDGYYDAKNGEGNQYYGAEMTGQKNWDKPANTTLYAKWTAKTYTVGFNTDGGSTAPEEIQVTFDTTYGSKGNFPTNPDKANHTFDGWYLGGTKITQDSVLKTAENHQLKASWTEIGKYMITYNSNRGDGSNDETRESALAHINTPITLLGADAFSNTGHSFAGWNTKADGSGTPPYAAGATYTGDKNITLYAKWTANKYTVNLDREGGTTGSTSVEAIYDSAMPSAEAPTREGYTFDGYYDDKNGAGNQYYNSSMASENNWDKDSGATLYAKWTANTYTVTLDPNGGSDGTTTFDVTYGSALPNGKVAPTRTGYTFDGYYDAKNGEGNQYYGAEMTGQKNWDKPANTTLYAKWTAKTYTVTFDKQSGSGGSDSVTATYDSGMPTATAPTRTGYTFGGYYDAANGGGVQYYNSSMVSQKSWDKDAGGTLYAKWTVKTYTVTFDKQSGSGGSDSVTATYDSGMPTATAPTRTGYTFDGYYDNAGGTGTQYYNAGMVSQKNWDKDSGATLYAKWTANKYTVNLDREGGTTGSTSVEAIYDSAMPSAEAPTREGYTFGGYYDAANGGGVQYYNSSMVSQKSWDKDAGGTLYAKWTVKTYTVTFDKQSGSGGSDSVTATYDSGMPTATAPTRTGYTFDGYYDNAGGTGTQYYNAGMVSQKNWDKDSGATLYAKWTANKYTVNLDREGGTTGSTSVEAIYDSAMPSAEAPTREGYTFDGYYDDKNGAGNQYYNSSMASENNWDKDAGGTLYAKWKAATYVVGDTGPAGGKIFYINEDYLKDGWQYLEAAPSDINAGIQWGGYGKLVGASGTGIGTGKDNTEKIVSALGTGNSAAKAAKEYSGGGFDDWFLPSKNELNAMYQQKSSIGGFDSANYWSSSESDGNYAWFQNFTNGLPNDIYKYYDYRVRPVRAF